MTADGDLHSRLQLLWTGCRTRFPQLDPTQGGKRRNGRGQVSNITFEKHLVLSLGHLVRLSLGDRKKKNIVSCCVTGGEVVRVNLERLCFEEGDQTLKTCERQTSAVLWVAVIYLCLILLLVGLPSHAFAMRMRKLLWKAQGRLANEICPFRCFCLFGLVLFISENKKTRPSTENRKTLLEHFSVIKLAARTGSSQMSNRMISFPVSDA